MSALICWILIVECVMEIKIAYGNDRVIITVPVHIRKLHHTKTIYKIVEKPVYQHPGTQQAVHVETSSTAPPAVLGVSTARAPPNSIESNSDDVPVAQPHDLSVDHNKTSYWPGVRSAEVVDNGDENGGGGVVVVGGGGGGGDDDNDDDDNDDDDDGRNVRNVMTGYGIHPAAPGYGYKSTAPDNDRKDAPREDTAHGQGYGQWDRRRGRPNRGRSYAVRKYPRPPAPVVEVGSESHRQLRGPYPVRGGDLIWHVRKPMHGHFAGGDQWRDRRHKQKLKRQQQQQYAAALKPPGRYGAGWHTAATATAATVVPVLRHDDPHQHKYRARSPVTVAPHNGYRVQENAAGFDDSFPVARDRKYTWPEAVDSPQFVNNVYYTLDPVVPYRERSIPPFSPDRILL